ncbi:hypothetical protein [Streptomyces virginiae]|uniref:hypothetical protein n=1 Tax=Streptomyces virginiae TaxID=1961 RepID=UPI002256793B|nr:hypothetical protein [Streptomyces virginiae]MCX4960282.1 hypothetical protein [Streptomyces virginiae]
MTRGRPAPFTDRSADAEHRAAAGALGAGRWARQEADRERLLHLLMVIGEAADGGLPGEWSEFERIVLHGSAGPRGRGYPPAGHDYPCS